MFSIDQNCHPLWDALPKVEALAKAGYDVTQFVEDVDVAFTAIGAGKMRLAKEQYHPTGGADWGAAMFYNEFLGRQPLDLVDLEPILGMKITALARQLQRSPQDLYNQFSPGDNWQLIGPSFVGDRDHHRIIGDLGISEVRPFLLELMQKAKGNLLHTFGGTEARRRTENWFRREETLLDGLLKDFADRSLAELYRDWLTKHLPERVKTELTSSLFGCGDQLLDMFIADYPRLAGLYNRAIEETGSKLRPLRIRDGELPCFAMLLWQENLVRTPMHFRENALHIGGDSFKLTAENTLPTEALDKAGIQYLIGKAILMVLQVRLKQPLGLPYRGSAYMPTVHRFASHLQREGLLPGKLHPVVRVRFRLLDRMGIQDGVIRLPDHLANYFSGPEISMRDFSRNYKTLARNAARRLERLKEPDFRTRWQKRTFPELTRNLARLQRRQQQLARAGAKREDTFAVWNQVKDLRKKLLEQTLRRIVNDCQIAEIGYYDSRGALAPWCVAMGGESFYHYVLTHAEIANETHEQEKTHSGSL